MFYREQYSYHFLKAFTKNRKWCRELIRFSNYRFDLDIGFRKETIKKNLVFISVFQSIRPFYWKVCLLFNRRYMAEILPLRRKTLSNQWKSIVLRPVRKYFTNQHCRWRTAKCSAPTAFEQVGSRQGSLLCHTCYDK